MKHIALLLVATFFMVIAQPAQAQFEAWQGPEFRVQGNAALTIPFEPIEFAEIWNVGYSIGGGASVFVLENIELGLQGTYTRFGTSSGPHSANQINFQRWTNGELFLPPNVDVSNVGISVGGGTFTAMSLQADIAYHLVTDVPVTPYFVIGPGLHYSQIDDALWDAEGEIFFGDQSIEIDQEGELEGRSETAFGIRLGVGADIDVGQNLQVKVEPSYTVLFGTEENVHFVPIRIGTVYTF